MAKNDSLLIVMNKSVPSQPDKDNANLLFFVISQMIFEYLI